MPALKRDEEREERIASEIIVDCYNEHEAFFMMGLSSRVPEAAGLRSSSATRLIEAESRCEQVKF